MIERIITLNSLFILFLFYKNPKQKIIPFYCTMSDSLIRKKTFQNK